MTRYSLVLIMSSFFSVHALGQPSGCEYPENGSYECKMGGVVLESGYFENGLKNGEFKKYTFGGKLLVQENYVDDRREGESRTFYEDGQLKFLRKYQNGIRTSDESFWEDGKHKYKRFADANGRQGTHYEYWQNGEPRLSQVWKDDVIQLSTDFNEQGNKIHEIQFTDGVDTYMRAYYPGGQLSEEGPLLQGYRDGHWKIYDEAGTLRMEGNYLDDKRIGEWKAYDEKGMLVQTKTF